MNTTCVQKITKQTFARILLGFGLLSCAWIANATTVQIQTVLGDIEVNLFDKQTPKTVENFLAYVESGAYSDSIIHRSVPDFIVQGGGFEFNEAWPPIAIPQSPTVVNEPVFSNVRGTIAMAKPGNNPNSATNQWFINLKNNSGNLDNQNGGFTVFGQVTGNGMAIIDAIAALPRPYLDQINTSVFAEIPLRDYTANDHATNVAIDEDHLVIVQGIVVLNASPDTADDLNPAKNTKNNNGGGGNDGGNNDSPNPGGSKGGGSVNINLLGLLSLFGLLVAQRGIGQRKK